MNRVCLIGRVTADIELKTSGGGTSFASFTLAVNRSRKVQGQPEADFIKCKVFGKTAETAARYLSKGFITAVEGRIETGSYTNQQGQRVYTTDVIVDNLTLLPNPKKEQGGYNGSYQNSYQSYQAPQTSQNPQPGYYSTQTQGSYQERYGIDSDIKDEDLPF